MSAPSRAYKTSAIVLRGRTYGEADRILTLLTSERGKADAIAKGARRPKSHLAGRLEFGNEVELGMHRGRTFDVVVSADTIAANWTRLVQPEHFAAANVMAELVDAFCEPDMPLPDIYALLSRALRAIAASDEPLALLPRFSLRLLDALGLAPPVDRCIRCDAPLDGAFLDAEQGGFAGVECARSWRESIALTEEDLQNIRALSAGRGAQHATLRATPAATRAVEALVNFHLGRRPRSAAHAQDFRPATRTGR